MPPGPSLSSRSIPCPFLPIRPNQLTIQCCLYALLSYCGLHWVLLMLKRGELRERFEIEGSTGQDCAEAYFCPCCTLVQNEKEVEKRSASVRTQTQTQTPYQAPGGMVYSK